VSSPLPANVPLIRSPVRSIILEKNSRKYDAAGLIALEKARERTAILGIVDDERTRSDLEFIDKDHLKRAIEQLAELTGPAGPRQPGKENALTETQGKPTSYD
jgi:hypothetical protein